MAFTDTLLVFIIIGFLIIVIWARIQGQTIIAVFYEIKDFIMSFASEDVVPQVN